MKKLLLLFIVFISVVQISCSADKKKDKPYHLSDYRESAMRYFPLAVGNSWKYKVNYFGQSGENEISIVGTDGEWFLDNKGGKLKVDRHGIRDTERYLLMFPLQRESWITIVNQKTREIRKTEGVDETVTVPAGTFEGTIKVHSSVELPDKKVLHTYHYFALKVGIVKIVTVLEDVREDKVYPQTTTELISYAVE
ncbi:hypothetical protein J6Z19_00800 [bacterium]|nr:hypothetical protein [bacterium]